MRRFVTKRILCALVCAALAMSAGCGVLSAAVPEADGLVINEVVSSNKRSLVDAAVGTPDWIELYNPTARAISLDGCGVSDSVKQLHKYVFGDVSVPPGGYLLVYAADADGAETDVPVTGFGLSKNGDSILLTDAYYGLLDELTVPALYADVSYARRADGTWGYCGVPTPGRENSEPIAATLDAVFDGMQLSALSISEVLPVNGDGAPWAELYNGGDTPLRLENYCLSDREDDVLRWQLPAASLGPGERALVYFSGLGSDGEGGLHADFRLGRDDTCLLLADLKGRTLDRLDWAQGLPAGVAALHRDGGGTAYTAYLTPGAENAADTFDSAVLSPMTADDPVRISEVLVHNARSVVDTDGDRGEWAELHNASVEAVALHGYFLSDDAEKPFKWALPECTLAPGEYLLVFLSGKDRTDPAGELHASFGLSEGETALYLTTVNGMRQDSLPLDGAARDDVSVGRDASGDTVYFAYPTPGYENGSGQKTADAIGRFDPGGVYISEVCAAHAVKSGEADWIELHNGGAAAVALAGWGLSDDPDEPFLWTLGDVTVSAGGYAVLTAESRAFLRADDAAPFGVRAGGETLVLTRPDGVTQDVFETGALSAGVTSGRLASDAYTARVFFTEATRGYANSERYAAGYAAQPTLSDTALYRSEPFSVTIACRTPDARVYYTTDGSAPTDASAPYTGPVQVDGSITLRAVAYADGLLPSEQAAACYLFTEPHTLPVVCLSANPREMRALLTTTSRTDKVEREALLSYYEADGALGTRFAAGLKPKGAGTLLFAQKSMSIHLRGGYGQTSVTYPFFGADQMQTFTALALRNGGQDWDGARLRDSFCMRLVTGMYVDSALTRPVVVYVNGVYYGLYDLNEDQNADYFAAHYGVEPENVDFIRRNDTVLAGSDAEFLRVRSYAENRAMRTDAAYEELCEWIDVRYFTDYFITQTYFGNADVVNQKYWRARDYSVKWRPILFDCDFAFVSLNRDVIGLYLNENGVISGDQSKTYFEIYIGLHKNAVWRRYCAERCVQVVLTYLNGERAGALLDEMAAEIRPEMARHIDRWGQPKSLATWEGNVRQLRNIVTKRPDVALELFRTAFGISKADMRELIEKYSQPTDAVEADPAA